MTTEFHGLYQRLTQVDRGIIGCRYGTISPQRDIPLIIDLYRRGEILLDELVSVTYPMAEYEAVIHAMESRHDRARRPHVLVTPPVPDRSMPLASRPRGRCTR